MKQDDKPIEIVDGWSVRFTVAEPPNYKLHPIGAQHSAYWPSLTLRSRIRAWLRRRLKGPARVDMVPADAWHTKEGKP